LKIRLVLLALSLIGSTTLIAAERRPVQLTIGKRGAVPEAVGGGFTVFLPIVGKVLGSTIFYTSLDVTNTANQSVPVSYFFFNTDGSIAKSGSLTTLAPVQNFHRDDFIQYMVERGILTSSQAANIFGTLLLTFDNASFTEGTEASAVARIFNYYPSGTSGPTIGLAYRGEVLQTNGAHKLSSVIRSTVRSNIQNGPVVYTNVGFQNMVIDDAGNSTTGAVTIRVQVFDASTGLLLTTRDVGPLGPGQSTITSDVWGAWQLPATTESAILVATQTAGTAQISGWVTILDSTTRDGSFFLMR